MNRIQRFRSSETPVTYERFARFVECLGSIYGIQLPLPDPSEDLKKFCEELVEGGDHPWRRLISRLSAKSRFGISHSLFLFRKVVPKEKPVVSHYVEKLSTPGEPYDQSFADYAVRLVKRIFRPGWDRKYQDLGRRSHFCRTACAESGRSEGGSKGLLAMKDSDRASFCEYVLMGSGHWVARSKNRPASIVQAVESGGKWRVIASPPRVDNALRALHSSMYDHLSRFEWLLRGDAKPERFKKFTPKEGEVFISGDYESATDNLNSGLQQLILSTVCDQSSAVPQGIVDHALSTYHSTLVIGRQGRDVLEQRRGQLMGQLTSFPMLCLLNYITFRYSFRGKKVPPVRVNGDDIVFRATTSDFDRWSSDVKKGGLTLSKGKTLVHSRGFTLNSTPFWSSQGGVKAVGFLRSSSVWKNQELSEQIRSLNSRFYSSYAGFGHARANFVKRLFLRENSRAIYASRRSVTRGLGLKCGEEVLRKSFLFDRECFYLSYPCETDLPLSRCDRIEGWTQESSYRFTDQEIKAWKMVYSSACLDNMWFTSHDPNNFSEELIDIQSGCVPYGLPSGRKYRKMLGLSREQCWRLVLSRRDHSVFGREKFKKKGKVIWVLKDCLYTSKRILRVPFVRSGGERYAGDCQKVSSPDHVLVASAQLSCRPHSCDTWRFLRVSANFLVPQGLKAWLGW